MKYFISASLVAAAVIGSTNIAVAKGNWKDHVQFKKDGTKSYAKNCINGGTYCGNWNVHN